MTWKKVCVFAYSFGFCVVVYWLELVGLREAWMGWVLQTVLLEASSRRRACIVYYMGLCCVWNRSFGGTDEVAEKKDAAPQIVPESRRIEEKDLLFFIMFNSVVVFPGACVCRKWSWWSGMLLH